VKWSSDIDFDVWRRLAFRATRVIRPSAFTAVRLNLAPATAWASRRTAASGSFSLTIVGSFGRTVSRAEPTLNVFDAGPLRAVDRKVTVPLSVTVAVWLHSAVTARVPRLG
jgi:hypothetical protein